MWNNYGRVFAEYIYQKFQNRKFKSKIQIEGKETLMRLKYQINKLCLFQGILVTLLMAMSIENAGINYLQSIDL